MAEKRYQDSVLMHAVLSLRDVSKQYPAHRAVDSVSLEIAKGEFFSLLGPSGCGKTTTLRLIAGFEETTSGDIFLGGERINHLRPYQRNVSTVFQNYALFPHLTVRGNVEFGLKRQGMSDIQRRVRETLAMVELSGKEDRMPSQLSGGERQRVALARSLAVEPMVLLLDEPLSALDPNLRKQVRAELKELQRRAGITFLFITHDQEEALSLSDRIAVMHRGRLEQAGPPQEIYLKPRTRFVAGFLGAVNWIDGIGVRPESVKITRHVPPTGVHCRGAKVESSMFLGNCFHVHSRSDAGEPIVAEVARLTEEFRAGDSVQMWWYPSDELPLLQETQ